jgi:hypothetical protein
MYCTARPCNSLPCASQSLQGGPAASGGSSLLANVLLELRKCSTLSAGQVSTSGAVDAAGGGSSDAASHRHATDAAMAAMTPEMGADGGASDIASPPGSVRSGGVVLGGDTTLKAGGGAAVAAAAAAPVVSTAAGSAVQPLLSSTGNTASMCQHDAPASLLPAPPPGVNTHMMADGTTPTHRSNPSPGAAVISPGSSVTPPSVVSRDASPGDKVGPPPNAPLAVTCSDMAALSDVASPEQVEPLQGTRGTPQESGSAVPGTNCNAHTQQPLPPPPPPPTPQQQQQAESVSQPAAPAAAPAPTAAIDSKATIRPADPQQVCGFGKGFVKHPPGEVGSASMQRARGM